MDEPLQHLGELGLQFFKVLLFFAVMVLPTTWVCLRRLPDRSIVGRLAIGVTVGFGLFVVEAWCVGLWSLDWLIAFWLAHYVVATWLGMRQARGAAAAAASLPASAERSRLQYWLVLLPLAAAAVLQLYALQFSRLPPGVDSSFHCVVAQRQLDAGRTTMDLWPLEYLKLNYPIGSHLWLAVAARWTGLEVHEVFRHSFALALCGAALCVGAWTEKMFGSPGHATAGTFAFVFVSYQASFFPYTWGGLPSALAMWQGLAAWYCLFHIAGRGGLAASMLLFGSAAMTHHHTMVALLGASGLVAAAGYLYRREHRAACRRILLALVGGAAIASIYLVPLVARVNEVNNTGMLSYSEDFAWPWEHLWNWGPALLIALAVALATPSMPEFRSARWFLMSIAIVWLVCFVALDYACGELSLWVYGKRATPFTPSRFLFDVQFVAAIFAGGGLWRIWQWLRRPAFRYALVAGVACWGIWRTEPLREALPSDMLLTVGAWARSNLPDDALVTGPPNYWLTYLCRRESTSLFIPISEPVKSHRRDVKGVLLLEPHRLSAEQWRALLGKSIYVIGSVWDESWGVEPVFVDEPVAMFDIN